MNAFEETKQLVGASAARQDVMRSVLLWMENLPTDAQLDVAAGPELDQRRTGRALIGAVVALLAHENALPPCRYKRQATAGGNVCRCDRCTGARLAGGA